jgi:hypothetical protein
MTFGLGSAIPDLIGARLSPSSCRTNHSSTIINAPREQKARHRRKETIWISTVLQLIFGSRRVLVERMDDRGFANETRVKTNILHLHTETICATISINGGSA